MSKYLVKYDEWTEVSEQTGTIQNIDGGCPIEVSTIQVEGSGVILYPWEMKPFSNVQLYVRGYNKNPLPTEVRVVPFEVGQGGGGGGGSYVLPTATATRLGGVKIGRGITVALDGTISVNGAGIDAWAANTPYPVGIYVTYNDDLYLCTTAHTSGAAFDSAKWKKIGEIPIATSSTLGGVKIGNGITVSNDGTISADGIPEWAAATAYSKGVYVTHDDDLYLCTIAHTSTTTFDSSKWKKIGCDGCKIEAWAANTDYEAGDYVTYQNDLYLCVNQHTSGSTFDPTKWKLIGGTGSGIEFWAANTEYVAGNYVTYQDDLYLCTTAHTSGSTFDNSKWKLIGGESGGIDFWTANTDYVLGDYVTYQNKLYLCTTAHTSSTRFAPTKWKEIGELPVATASVLGGVKIGQGITVASDGTISWSGIPDWTAETDYSTGEYVTHQNDLYLCTTAHTSTTTFDGTKWKLIGCDGCKIKEWAANTDYALGDYATYQNSLYLCTTAHTTSATFDSTKWRKIGTDFWKANTDYVLGDYVTYQNNLYLCTTAHTSGTAFDATKWEMIGDLPIATASTLGGVKIGAGIHVEADGTISADGGISEWETAKAYAVGNYVTVYNYGRQGWQDDTAYSAGDFVTNDENLYKCIVSHTAGSIFADDLAANKWVQVPREGGLYICVKAHTSNDFHDDFIVDGKWNAIRNGIDFWSTTKHYEVGQYVTVPDDYKRDEWQANTAYSTGDIVKVYNRGKSEWATGTSYGVGDYATMGKALYRCEAAHTSTTFADDVADGDWTLVDTIVEQFSCLEGHTSSGAFDTDFAAEKWKTETEQMDTCICAQEHISDDFSANFAAGKWQAVGGNADESSGGGGGGIELADVTNASAVSGDSKVSLKWTDPDDITYSGATLARWAGTKLVRKEGSAPESASDGTVVVDSKTRNAYSSTAYEDSGLTNNTTYYYRFFPYSTAGAYTTGTSLNATPTPKPKATMSVSPTSVTAVAGQTVTITVTSNCTGAVSAVSSDTSKATVSVNDKIVTVTGVAVGSATITISQDEDTTYAAPDDVTVSVTVPAISSTLNDNSWAQISQVAKAGNGDLYWDIGDCKEITLNGKVGNQLTLSNQKLCVFILDFNHATNGTAENNIIFGGFKTTLTNGTDVALADDQYEQYKTNGTIMFNMNHWGNYNYGGWKGCDLRYDVLGATSTQPSDYGKQHTTSCVGYDATAATLTNPKANTLLAALPADLRSNMRLWTRYVDAVGNSSDVDANIKATVDAITLLNEPEIFTSRSYANQYEYNRNTRMAYYANGNGTIKKKHSDGSTAVIWWESSPYYNSANGFCYVNTNGNAYGDHGAHGSHALSPAFKM